MRVGLWLGVVSSERVVCGEGWSLVRSGLWLGMASG